MFCPFINEECKPECIFNNNCFDEGDRENCNLMDAVRNIQSDGFDEYMLKDYLEDMGSKLDAIQLNTGSDQSESWEISGKLDDILRKLEVIQKKL